MHSLVTGGAGFIGSHICEMLLREGHDVTCVDSLHTGNQENLGFAKDNHKFHFVKGNSGDIASLASQKYDGIFHQGIYSSSPMYKKEPLLTAKAIGEFISLLEFARAKDIPIIFASSSSLYNGLKPPHKEDMPIPVADYYAEARIAMERLAELYHRLYGMKIIALRYFSVYGPREESKKQYANLVSQFLWSLQKSEAPVIYGDGKQTRDFIYVSDVAQSNWLAFQAPIRFGVFNVGTGESTSLNKVIALWNKKLGKDIHAKHVENKIKNYVQHTRADTAKAEKGLGFKAKISLEEGTDKLIAYHGAKK